MNTEMIMTMVRQGLLIVGTLATTLGWLTPDQVGKVSAAVLSLAGPVLMLVSVAYGLYMKTQTNMITVAAQQTDSNGIKLVNNVSVNPLAEGAAQLVKDTPNNVNLGVHPAVSPTRPL